MKVYILFLDSSRNAVSSSVFQTIYFIRTGVATCGLQGYSFAARGPSLRETINRFMF